MRTPMRLFAMGATLLAACTTTEPNLPPDTVNECVDFCDAAMTCRLDSGEQEIGDFVASPRTAKCAYDDQDAVRYACVAACSPLVDQAEGPSRACLTCRATTLTSVCPARPFRFDGCDSECPRGVDDFWFGLEERKQLSCWGAAPNETAVSACTAGTVAPRVVVGVIPPPEAYSAELTTTATVMSVSPLVVAATTPALQVQLPGVPGNGIAVGAVVTIAMNRDCPFGCWRETVVLRDPATQELLVAAWGATADALPSLPELDLAYTSLSCASDRVECGIRAPLALVARDSSGQTSATADAGATATIGNYEIGNGASHANLLWACTDTPPSFTYGYVAKRAP